MTRIGLSDDHWSVLMVSFAAISSQYYQSCEGSDYGNKPIYLPFQSWNVIEFLSPLLLVPLARRNLLHCIYISTLVCEIIFSYDVLLVVFAKTFLFSSIF